MTVSIIPSLYTVGRIIAALTVYAICDNTSMTMIDGPLFFPVALILLGIGLAGTFVCASKLWSRNSTSLYWGAISLINFAATPLSIGISFEVLRNHPSSPPALLLSCILAIVGVMALGIGFLILSTTVIDALKHAKPPRIPRGIKA